MTSRVILTQSRFSVAFEVRKLSTTTTLTRVRNTDTGLKVTGTVIAQNGLTGPGAAEDQGLRKNGWRTLSYRRHARTVSSGSSGQKSAKSVIVTTPGFL